MSEERRTIIMHGDENQIKILLPDGRGAVRVYLNLVDTQTGRPVTLVELTPGSGDKDYVWETDDASTFTKCRIVGRPTVRKQEKDHLASLMRAHTKGDHSGCPEGCTT